MWKQLSVTSHPRGYKSPPPSLAIALPPWGVQAYFWEVHNHVQSKVHWLTSKGWMKWSSPRLSWKTWHQSISNSRILRPRSHKDKLLYFINKSQPPNLQQPPPWSSSSHQHQGNSLHQQFYYDTLRAQMMVSILSKC